MYKTLVIVYHQFYKNTECMWYYNHYNGHAYMSNKSSSIKLVPATVVKAKKNLFPATYPKHLMAILAQALLKSRLFPHNVKYF